MRAALAGGAILLAGWLTALTLGALGGFESLPELKLGGGSEKQTADQPEATEATAESAQGSVARNDRSLGGSDQDAVEGDGPPSPSARNPSSKVVKPVRAPAAPAPTTGSTNGNANGQSTTKTTGKPETTPGTGSTGTTNAGGNGNGKANCLYK